MICGAFTFIENHGLQKVKHLDVTKIHFAINDEHDVLPQMLSALECSHFGGTPRLGRK